MKKVSGPSINMEVWPERHGPHDSPFTFHVSLFTIFAALALCLFMPLSTQAADKLVVKDAGGNAKFVVTDTGQVAIGTDVPGQDVDIVAPNNGLVRLSNTTADNTVKASRMVVRHYLNIEEPLYLFGAASTSTNNFVALGGGSTIGNAATQIDFYTAPNTATLMGTARMTIDKNGNIGVATSAPSQKLDVNSDGIRIRTAKTPASSTATCNQGEIAWDTNYVYVCVATNSWRRSALSSW